MSETAVILQEQEYSSQQGIYLKKKQKPILKRLSFIVGKFIIQMFLFIKLRPQESQFPVKWERKLYCNNLFSMLLF